MRVLTHFLFSVGIRKRSASNIVCEREKRDPWIEELFNI